MLLLLLLLRRLRLLLSRMLLLLVLLRIRASGDLLLHWLWRERQLGATWRRRLYLHLTRCEPSEGRRGPSRR